MKRTKLLLATIMSILLAFGLNAQSFTHAQPKNFRADQRIKKKIKHGIRSGKLNKRELKDLKSEYRKIEKMKRRAWRDGHLSRRERHRIDHAMHDFDRLLHRYLHNRIDRYDRYHGDKHRYHSDRDWDWDDDHNYNNRDYYHRKKRNRH